MWKFIFVSPPLNNFHFGYWIIVRAEGNDLRLARGWRPALIRHINGAGQTKMFGDSLLEMQQGSNHVHVKWLYRFFSVHSQSMVSFASAASGSSSAFFLSAQITGNIALSIKGTWRKSVKVRRGGCSLQITTCKKHPIKILPRSTATISCSCILPKDMLSKAVLWQGCPMK